MARIGTRLAPHLTVLGTVGSGGDGRVLIVWNHDAWCPMACKIFEAPRDARREGRVLAALRHPNIVRLLGRGTHRGREFVLTEFLDGLPLSRVSSRSPSQQMSVSDAMRVAIHLGGAISHVHDRGFLHLDVKPANIIVTAGRPVLFDFSIACNRANARSTRPVGTDAYMAPEQCGGGHLTVAADVFGYGVTLYELLTGVRPFPEGTRRRPFTQLSVAATGLRRHRPAVPRQLEDLVMACLERDPADRPRSPAELLPQFHHFVKHGPPMWPTDLVPAPRSSAARPPATSRRC